MDVMTLALAKRYADKIAGLQGKDGATWYHGDTVPDTSQGNDGDYYLRTDSGDVYKKDGDWAIVGNIQGPQGEDGSLIGNYDGGRPASVYANLQMDGGIV